MDVTLLLLMRRGRRIMRSTGGLSTERELPVGCLRDTSPACFLLSATFNVQRRLIRNDCSWVNFYLFTNCPF